MTSYENPKGDADGPLSGIRIIEWGTNITAPLAAMWLADQGANVIKVESPAGDQFRQAIGFREGVPGLAATFVNANRNKRSIVLDIKRPGAVEAFKELVKNADVLLHNFRPGVMERLGLSYEELTGVKEDIIYVSVSGFGATGPYSKQKAYDPIIQGISGVMGAQRDAESGAPNLVRNAIADKVTATVIFQAVTAALFAREKSKKGQHVRVNMLNALVSFFWPDGMANHTWLGDNIRTGAGYKDARLIYQTRDSYLVASANTNQDWAVLCAALGKPQLIEDPRFKDLNDRVNNFKAAHDELRDSFLEKTTEEWLGILREHDTVCGPINTEETLHQDPQVLASGMLIESEHPHGGSYRQPIHPVYFDNTPASIRLHAPMLGEQTVEILREVGMDQDKIDDLLATGAIKQMKR